MSLDQREHIPPCTESWWVGLDQETFYKRAKHEFERRMRFSSLGESYMKPGSVSDVQLYSQPLHHTDKGFTE